MNQNNKKKVLFYDKQGDNRRSASTMLAAAGCTAEIPWSEASFISSLKTQQYDLLIYPLEYHELVSKITNKSTEVPAILLSQAKIKDLGRLFSQHGSANILAKNKDGTISSNSLITTINKIFRQNIFGVEHYLPHGTRSEIYHVRDSRERSEYLDTIKEYCSSLHIRRSVIQAVELFCEELLMNAIYDAPRDENGEGRFSSRSRREHVQLKPQQAARMEFACDGEKLVVSVSDPFGAITWQTIHSYLQRCFSEDRKITNLSQNGGAGLGLYMSFLATNSFIVNVQPGERSEFIGIFNLTVRPQDKRSQYASLHFFSTESEKPKQTPTPSKKSKLIS